MFELSIQPIDLGLSVCWGSANVDTYGYDTKLGPMFAWGECQTKESFTQGSYTLHPYVPSNYWKPLKYKTVDPTKGPVVLAPEDDAATQIEGDNWRMPTIEECKELFERCSWHFTEYAKTKGWVVKGPKYGSIFIPVTDDVIKSSYCHQDRQDPPHRPTADQASHRIRGSTEDWAGGLSSNEEVA